MYMLDSTTDMNDITVAVSQEELVVLMADIHQMCQNMRLHILS